MWFTSKFINSYFYPIAKKIFIEYFRYYRWIQYNNYLNYFDSDIVITEGDKLRCVHQ